MKVALCNIIFADKLKQEIGIKATSSFTKANVLRNVHFRLVSAFVDNVLTLAK